LCTARHGDLLYDERLAHTLGESLTESLKVVLVERAGLNLRNLVAQGMALSETFAEPVADLLIALLVQVAAAFGPTETGAPHDAAPAAPEARRTDTSSRTRRSG
jgi:hypothetical protein